MKIELEATEVKQEGNLLRVTLKTGYGDPEILVAADMAKVDSKAAAEPGSLEEALACVKGDAGHSQACFMRLCDCGEKAASAVLSLREENRVLREMFSSATPSAILARAEKAEAALAKAREELAEAKELTKKQECGHPAICYERDQGPEDADEVCLWCGQLGAAEQVAAYEKSQLESRLSAMEGVVAAAKNLLADMRVKDDNPIRVPLILALHRALASLPAPEPVPGKRNCYQCKEGDHDECAEPKKCACNESGACAEMDGRLARPSDKPVPGACVCGHIQAHHFTRQPTPKSPWPCREDGCECSEWKPVPRESGKEGK